MRDWAIICCVLIACVIARFCYFFIAAMKRNAAADFDTYRVCTFTIDVSSSAAPAIGEPVTICDVQYIVVECIMEDEKCVRVTLARDVDVLRKKVL